MSVVAYNNIFKSQNLLYMGNIPFIVFIDNFNRLGITRADTNNYKITYIDDNVTSARSEYTSNAEILYLKNGNLYFTTPMFDSYTQKFNKSDILEYAYGVPDITSFKLIRNGTNLEVTLSSEPHNISRINRHENGLGSEPFCFADLSEMILETISISPRYFGIMVTKDINIKTVDLFRGLY